MTANLEGNTCIVELDPDSQPNLIHYHDHLTGTSLSSRSQSGVAQGTTMLEANYEHGVEMHQDNQVFCCELQVFLSYYLPQRQLPAGDLEARSKAGLKRAQSLFKENPEFTSEADISRRLSQIVDAILGSCKATGKRLWSSLDQNKTNVSAMLGGTFRINSCLKNDKGGPLRTTDIIVPIEIQLLRNYDGIRLNRLRLASAVVQIMNDDVRRMFIFGITVEAHRMTLWYFSRNHSAKTQSFDFVKNPDTLVSVLMSLVFADNRELGFDPNISLKSNTGRQFIYTVHGGTGPRRFLTTHSIAERRAFRCTTRVFRVVELDERTDSPRRGAKPIVLKDAWLDEGARTEQEIQQELFADIRSFAENPDWRKHDCLSGFHLEEHVPIMNVFGRLLEGESWKDLFLVIQDSSTGETIKQLTRSAWRTKSPIFLYDPDPEYSNHPFSSTKHSVAPEPKPSDNFQYDLADQGASKPDFRHYPSKQRTFVLFDDECTSLYCLPTVGDVFTVLNDCVTSLRLMYCAGWVHCDISCNNIMAVRDSETQQWKLKLADLEYSKKFGLQTGTSDLKAGTPFFMPCEILCRRYFGDDDDVTEEDALARFTMDPNDDETSETPEVPLLHNFLHDLEASFWTGLWIITSRVNHEPSRLYALGIFKNTLTLTLPESRLKAFRKPIKDALNGCLLEKLKKLAPTFEAIRKMLHTCAKVMGKKRTWWESPGYKIYSSLHANFALAFASLADPHAPWASVPLQLPTSSSPQPMKAIVDADPNNDHVAPVSGNEDKARAEEQGTKKKNKMRERLPRRVKPRRHGDEAYTPAASGRKRSHREGEQADNDDGEGKSSNSKRVRSNNGGRVSASGPSGASTSAGRSSAYRLRSKGRN